MSYFVDLLWFDCNRTECSVSDILRYGIRTLERTREMLFFATAYKRCCLWYRPNWRQLLFAVCRLVARSVTDRQTAGLTVLYEGGPSHNYSCVEKGFDLAVSRPSWLQAATRCCREGDSIALKLLIAMGAGITWCVCAAGPFRRLVRPSVPLRRCLADVERSQQNRETLPVILYRYLPLTKGIALTTNSICTNVLHCDMWKDIELSSWSWCRLWGYFTVMRPLLKLSSSVNNRVKLCAKTKF